MTTPRERLAALPPLSAWAHEHVGEGACVMEAVSYVAGEPWSDTPACACPVLGAFLRTWNDDLSDTDLDRLLRPLVLRLVGSRSTPEVEARRSWLAMDWLVRTHAPAWLQLVPALVPHADALTDLPPIMDAQTATAHQSTFNAARVAARAAVEAAAGNAAVDAARVAARVAVEAAAGDAAEAAAGDAAEAAARVAVGAAAGDAAWAAARAAAGDAAEAAVGAAAWVAARAAAWDALQPTTATLQRSALDLVDRMLAEAEPQ